MYQDRNFFIKSSGERLVIRLTFLFVLYWTLNFHLVQSHNNFSPGQAQISFCSDASKKGHRLNTTVYDDRHSLSHIDCVVQCVYESCCRSINYRKRDPFNGKENCELLHAVASEQPAEDLKEDKDYDYDVLRQPNRTFDCHCYLCQKNGSCETSKKSCSCGSGFTGKQCEKDVDECSSNRCHQNSTCNNTVGSYTCTCNHGFTGNGDNCKDVNECATNRCHANATCNNTMGSFSCTCNTGFFGDGLKCADSIILKDHPKFHEQIEDWLPVKKPRHLCYRASRDGWKGTDFHSRCDGKRDTVTIVSVGIYIFGGYVDVAWGGLGGWKSSSTAFLFSLRNKDNLNPFKAPVYRRRGYAIYDYSGYGPIFGGGHDLKIANNAHLSENSYTSFGYTYQAPSGYTYGQPNTRALLAGSYRFIPSEVEVFYLR